jgi:predicted kinase
MLTITIMQGPSGSGKTFHGERIAAETGASVRDSDSFPGLYNEDGSINVGELGNAHGWCFKNCIEDLQAGRSVIVANTNTTALEMAPYVQLAQAFGAEPKIVRVVCDASKALARNVHGVPAAAHEGQVARIEAFEPAFHWKFIPGFEITEIEN